MGIKKFLVCTVLLTSIFSTCNAAQVRISDEKMEDFFLKMASFIYSDSVQQKFPAFITNLEKDEEGIADYDLDVWYAFFGKKENENPDGQLLIFADKDGYVSATKVILMKNDNKDIEYSIMVGSILWSMDLTSEETQHLMTGGDVKDGIYVADLRSEAKNKTFLLMMAEESERVQVMVMAGDKN